MKTDRKLRVKLKSYKAYQGPVLLAVMALLSIVGIKIIFRSHADTQPPGSGAAASRDIFWGSVKSCENITDAELTTWKANGVGGMGCSTGPLDGLGGADQAPDGMKFQKDPVNTTSPPSGYETQALLQKADIPGRFTSKGIDTYLMFDTSNAYDQTTPFYQWWDDTKWNTYTIPAIEHLAAAAKTMGFTGIGIDHEAYYGENPFVDYFGNVHTEQETRDQVYKRGQQVMRAILSAFPNAKFINYGQYFPGTWADKVQNDINSANPTAIDRVVYSDFWDGMTSVQGYGDIYMGEFTFYKSYNGIGPSWDNAFQYDINGSYAAFSQIMRSWSLNSSNKIHVTPMVAISPVDQYPQNSASQVATQLDRARYYGTGGAFINYTYDMNSCNHAPGCSPFPHDFEPPGIPNWFNDGTGASYIPGMQAAAQPGTVETTPPTLSLLPQFRSGCPSNCGSNVTFSGSATDNIGIRSVSWSAGSASGMATMYFHPTPGPSISPWEMDWNFNAPVSAGTNVTITLTDAKGLITSTTVAAAGTTSDNPPTVSLSSNLTLVSPGSSAVLSANVSDSDSTPVSKVEFYDAEVQIGTVTTAPYNLTWNTSSAAAFKGKHNITARVYDTAGLNTTSAVLPVTVGSAPVILSAPTGLTVASKTANSVTLSWNAVSGSNLDRCLILRDYTVIARCSSASSTSYTDTTVNPNTVYQNPGYQVVSVDTNKNQSPPSNPVTVTTPASTTLIAAPTNLQTTATAPYNVSLSWTASTSSGLTEYRILRNGLQVGIIAASNLAFTDNSAEAGNTYNYSIRAKSGNDQSPDSSALSVPVSGTSTTNNADFNGDGHVNITDLSILASNWGSTTASHLEGDANGDGKVDISDLSILASQWGT